MNTTLRSTLQLLRFHFSFFLMPVYWFALSQVNNINWRDATLIFIILHLLVYPASNGYNSYMDRDTGSIGGIKNPLQPTKQLFYVTIIMDVTAIAISFLITPLFALGILLYILASRAYSWRKIRLKKYPVIGYLTVIIFQGAVTFFLVYHGSESNHITDVPVIAMIAASLLIGGFYPLTQIYQHEDDMKDGVQTISYKLGYKGTFIFTGIIYAMAFTMLAVQFFSNLEWNRFLLLQIFMFPVLVYFFAWFSKVLKNTNEANFKNTMRMNLLASISTNAGFITILILHLSE
ncbi:MAG TPA: UbiA family prenyltransferase [Chitinophagaceae bacterium]|nr:UbiA family prenyltransferase [Chitinophagaceae bacterium]